MKMNVLTAAVLVALASQAALAANEGTASSDSDVIVTGTHSDSNDYFLPPFGGAPVRIVQPTQSASNVYWQPPFGGTPVRIPQPTQSASNVYWQPPFGGTPVRIPQPTASASVEPVHTSDAR